MIFRPQSAVDSQGSNSSEDAGNAVVEFVFIGILVLVPLIYVVLTASMMQRSLYGVTHAAREAGRAYGTAIDSRQGEARARYAARIAVEDQGLSAEGLSVRYGAPGESCAQATSAAPELAPGAIVAVCVTRSITLPGVPGLFAGDRNVVTGRFVVHLDQYRAYHTVPTRNDSSPPPIEESVG